MIVKKYAVCGISIAALSPAGAAASIVSAATSGSGCEVHLCNAYTLSLVDQDERLSAALGRAHLNLPDGSPVAWLGRRLGTAGPVRGPALVVDVARAGADVGVRHFLYGGAPGTAEEMRQRLEEAVPGVQVVGTECPPFRELDDAEVADLAVRVSESGAHVVWIGLGTPKQDYLVPRLADHVEAVVIPVGAAFDFIAGRVREAPHILHGTGLEWVYRLTREPRRLWRRYVIGNPKFVFSALHHRFRSGRPDRAGRSQRDPGVLRTAGSASFHDSEES